MRIKLGLGTALVTLVTLVACSGQDGSAPSSGPSGGSSGEPRTTTEGTQPANGVTPCGKEVDGTARTCPAGRYCRNEGLSICENGCLSNGNCSSDQTCEKPKGEDVGACTNKTPASQTSCVDLCKKAIACGVDRTQAQCEAACLGLSEACKACTYALPCNAEGEACKTACGL